MLKRLLGLGRNPNRAIVDALYSEIVAAARQQPFYAQWGVPDTPLGRFEMLSLHVFLFLHRVRDEERRLRDLAQQLTDDFFADVDHSLRELGIGDLGIPKRMKKLARMFYGRVSSYGTAIEAGDRQGLAEALRRNVLPERADWPQAAMLADYALSAHRHLAELPADDFLAGRLSFPKAAGEGTPDA